jgi:hypothetical protein
MLLSVCELTIKAGYKYWMRVLMFFAWVWQRYVELFRSTKGEMMTAVQQRMYGMFSGVGGFSQFGAVSQVSWIVADICLET